MVNNTTNLERIGYISNINPQPQQKTHFLKPRGVIGVKEKPPFGRI